MSAPKAPDASASSSAKVSPSSQKKLSSVGKSSSDGLKHAMRPMKKKSTKIFVEGSSKKILDFKSDSAGLTMSSSLVMYDESGPSAPVDDDGMGNPEGG